ncbi:MAG: NAD-dependent epimerase/dehydratase family protein [Thiotrichaceae bacterium]
MRLYWFHMVKMLLAQGYHVVTLDNLSGGHRDAVLGGDFVFGDLADRNCLNYLFKGYHFDGVMHFASFCKSVNQCACRTNIIKIILPIP